MAALRLPGGLPYAEKVCPGQSGNQEVFELAEQRIAQTIPVYAAQ